MLMPPNKNTLYFFYFFLQFFFRFYRFSLSISLYLFTLNERVGVKREMIHPLLLLNITTTTTVRYGILILLLLSVYVFLCAAESNPDWTVNIKAMQVQSMASGQEHRNSPVQIKSTIQQHYVDYAKRIAALYNQVNNKPVQQLTYRYISMAANVSVPSDTSCMQMMHLLHSSKLTLSAKDYKKLLHFTTRYFSCIHTASDEVMRRAMIDYLEDAAASTSIIDTTSPLPSTTTTTTTTTTIPITRTDDAHRFGILWYVILFTGLSAFGILLTFVLFMFFHVKDPVPT